MHASPRAVRSAANSQQAVMRMHPSDAERAGDSLALPGEEGLLVVLGEEEAEPGVLPGLQDAVEEVARQPGAHSVTAPARNRLLEGWSSPRPCARQLAACVAHALAMKALVPCTHSMHAF